MPFSGHTSVSRKASSDIFLEQDPEYLFEGHLRLAQLDKVLVGGAGWKASNVQVGFTQLLSAAVVAAVVAAVCAGAGRSHGVGSWCIGLLETEQNKKAVTGKGKIVWQKPVLYLGKSRTLLCLSYPPWPLPAAHSYGTCTHSQPAMPLKKQNRTNQHFGFSHSYEMHYSTILLNLELK